MNALLEQLSRFGVGRLIAIFGLTAGAAAALVVFTMSMNGSGEALLFSGLEPDDAAAATERLDQAGISYTLREGGSSIYVDSSEVDAARMRVAADGALSFGSVGYEIFDETDALGTTSFVQNVNARRALEGELARSINTIAAIASSRVHLVLPERRLFSRETEEPSASVVLSVRGDLDSGQVETVRNLVATAVPGLSANRITVADDTGRLLASPGGGDTATVAALEGQRADFESRLSAKIRDVVEGVVGPGGARVVVTAEINRENLTESRQEYDPDAQVLVSRETSEEFSREPADRLSGGVSVSENQPEAEGGATSERQMAETGRESDIRNFQNSSVTSTRVVEAGGVERLSVAVVVDGETTVAEGGAVEYAPRTPEEMEQIRALVRSAMGFDEERGDQLEVTNMRFSRPDIAQGSPAPEGFSLSREDMMRIAEIAVLFITALLIVLLVARPLVKGVVAGPQPALAGAGGGARLPESGQGQAAVAAGDEHLSLPEGDGGGDADERIDVDQIEGQVKKSSVRKVSSLIEQHPEETMSILRNWMHES
ncbi:flagellar M-ring protein FliF [Marinicauda salina]|uniref:Flagellar M-ring protein n=1 Tax=Marinicauda salina TaxID=2135793 RepID=A0A2U2BS02_9PROT|nr:flagellar basal-body MS-ring/collar protein FliF [Marinicauda salina]PWE16769.1 flagellar M-ring protein FliF [Marinicauda salina]